MKRFPFNGFHLMARIPRIVENEKQPEKRRFITEANILGNVANGCLNWTSQSSRLKECCKLMPSELEECRKLLPDLNVSIKQIGGMSNTKELDECHWEQNLSACLCHSQGLSEAAKKCNLGYSALGTPGWTPVLVLNWSLEWLCFSSMVVFKDSCEGSGLRSLFIA